MLLKIGNNPSSKGFGHNCCCFARSISTLKAVATFAFLSDVCKDPLMVSEVALPGRYIRRKASRSFGTQYLGVQMLVQEFLLVSKVRFKLSQHSSERRRRSVPNEHLHGIGTALMLIVHLSHLYRLQLPHSDARLLHPRLTHMRACALRAYTFCVSVAATRAITATVGPTAGVARAVSSAVATCRWSCVARAAL